MDIVQAIKNEAFKQDISLAEIARKLDMKPQNFSQILRIESIKFAVVEKIATILNVSIDYLLGKVPQNGNIGNVVNQKNVVGNNSQENTVYSGNTERELIDLLKSKDEQINNLIQIISKLKS